MLLFYKYSLAKVQKKAHTARGNNIFVYFPCIRTVKCRLIRVNIGVYIKYYMYICKVKFT